MNVRTLVNKCVEKAGSQVALAKKIGVHSTCITRYVAGAYKPRVPVRNRMREYLGANATITKAVTSNLGVRDSDELAQARGFVDSLVDALPPESAKTILRKIVSGSFVR